jgi:hypothetical protein
VIRIAPQPEPDDFDERVRQPGLKALAKKPPPRELPDYWTRCAEQLWQAYRGICAYLCVLIPRGTGARTVEHLAPKSKHRDLTYEWSNYRLVSALMNSRKRDFEDVLDPVAIENEWFVLELSFLQVLPKPELDKEIKGRVQATIDRLKLNDQECRQARALYYDAYLNDGIKFEYLERWSPFVALEMRRQGIVPASPATLAP